MSGMRDFSINKNAIDSLCLRCSETKDWDHVVKCRRTDGKRDVCSRKLRSKLVKTDDANEDSIKINKISSDISKCIKNETFFETNQEML